MTFLLFYFEIKIYISTCINIQNKLNEFFNNCNVNFATVKYFLFLKLKL